MAAATSPLHDPPPFVALLLLPFLPRSSVCALAATSSAWRDLLAPASDGTWRVLCRALALTQPVACPPELCDGLQKWHAVYQSVMLPLVREWEALAAPPGATSAAEAAFDVRVAVRFRPPPDLSADEPAGVDRDRAVLVPLHQRLQALRECVPGLSRSAALHRVFRGTTGGGDADWAEQCDPFAGAALSDPGEGEGKGENAGERALPSHSPVPAPLAAAASVLPASDREVLCVAPRVGLRSFRFHCVLGDGAGQEACYAQVARGAVFAALSGRHACVFAYGQTGSGKTHSMSGDSAAAAVRVPVVEPATVRRAALGFVGGERARGAGIVPRAVADVIAYLTARCPAGGAAGSGSSDGPLAAWSLSLSVVEVYGDAVTDLLADGAAVGPWRAAAAAAVASGAVAVDVRSAAQAEALLARAEGLRRVQATCLNAHSSRAHTLHILDLVLTARGPRHSPGGAAVPGLGATRRARLVLADLGGSENVAASGTLHSAERLREALHINLSLLALKQCIKRDLVKAIEAAIAQSASRGRGPRRLPTSARA